MTREGPDRLMHLLQPSSSSLLSPVSQSQGFSSLTQSEKQPQTGRLPVHRRPHYTHQSAGVSRHSPRTGHEAGWGEEEEEEEEREETGLRG